MNQSLQDVAMLQISLATATLVAVPHAATLAVALLVPATSAGTTRTTDTDTRCNMSTDASRSCTGELPVIRNTFVTLYGNLPLHLFLTF